MPSIRPIVIAFAATLLSLPAAAQEAGPADGWGGFYAGLHLGFAGGRDDVAEINGPRRYFVDTDGVMGGGQAGWRWQHERLVLGLSLDAGSLGQSGTEAKVDAAGSLDLDTALGAYGTLTGHAGYLLGPDTLVYAKGGLVIADLDARTRISCAPPCAAPASLAETEDMTLGWTLGAGVERSLGGNWDGFAEYSYYRFRTELALPVTGAGFDHKLDLHALKVGVNWRF